jgi:hypothetical protein
MPDILKEGLSGRFKVVVEPKIGHPGAKRSCDTYTW